MKLNIGSVHSILIGKSSKFTRSGIYSAINKKPIFRSAYVDVNGIEGDEQGDLQWHGGPDKAIHIYA